MNTKKPDRVKENLEGLVKLFESGKVPAALAKITLPSSGVPSQKWSFMNQLNMLWHNTEDARGFGQWKLVDRYVKKGAKAIYIIVPRIKKEKDEETGEETVKILGFMARPVFRYEDTDGEPLNLPEYNPESLPPLIDVAKAWGINVSYKGFLGHAYGSYKIDANEISLATHDEQTFFHELSHAAQKRVWKEGIKGGQIPKQEMAAELSACVLARMFGRKDANEGYTFKYVKSYADEEGKELGKALWGVISATEKILKAITKEAAALGNVVV